MTACVLETAVDDDTAPARPAAPAPAEAPALTIAADGSYAARLLPDPDGGLFAERWTLDGPEPYAVRLPGVRPEEPGSEVLPLADGRVLIRRRLEGRHALALLYPAGPVTGEQPAGSVGRERLRLLPPAPDGVTAYALAPGERSTELWRVHGGPAGPERVTEIPGHCSGGAWLDRDGHLLALDRTVDGRTKTITVQLRHGGETSPLLRITEDSDDRLLLADPDSGLLLLRSNAPGHDRLGWGVLGSARPARFPGALLYGAGGPARPPGGTRADGASADGTGGDGGAGRAGSDGGAAAAAGTAPVPFAVQPGQTLVPEHCGVALRVDGPDGPRVGVWRPSEGRLRLLTAPRGWLAGTGLWTAEGELRLPYATADVPCGLGRMPLPATAPLLRPARVPRMAFRMISRRDLRAAAAKASDTLPGAGAPPGTSPGAPPAGAAGPPPGEPAPPTGGGGGGPGAGDRPTSLSSQPVGPSPSRTPSVPRPVPLREMPAACPGTSGRVHDRGPG
ncbi:hypothetical protein [Streptomyces xinghaiensis]|uniref:hypothetical protein n=1 Tax=Streptomyces xinghaiensis TaxID=1038928 RepID=UPI00186521CD|nr:hypothetical protein [Streptomyces xinghaiensis]